MSAVPGAPPAASVSIPLPGGPLFEIKSLVSRIVTLCWVEVCKIKHDRSELYTRAIQPALWLLITGKAFAAGVRSVIQAAVVVILSAILGVSLTANPLKLLGVVVVVVPGSAFFSCLSMTIAGLALQRDRLMGIGQAITMPLFFSSSALYPVAVMPGWLQAITRFNPLSYEVDALRGLLIGIPTNLALDLGVLVGVTVAGIVAAATLLPRLAKG